MDEVNEIKKGYMESSMLDKPKELASFREKHAKKSKELSNVSAMLIIVVKRLTNSKGNLMPEWEEVAAVSCAVQNMHLALTTRWQEAYGGYWSSGGWNSWLECPAMKAYCGADGVVNGEADKVLGIFYLGKSRVEKMNAYRAKRGDIQDKVEWK